MLSFFVAYSGQERILFEHSWTLSNQVREAVCLFLAEPSIHNLMLAIASEEKCVRDHQEHCVPAFLACLSHNAQGLTQGSVITHYIAAIKYGLRLCVLYETDRWLEDLPATCIVRNASDVEPLRLITDAGNFNFGVIHVLSKRISSKVLNEPVCAQTYWDDDRQGVMVRNAFIDTQVMRKLVHSLVADAKSALGYLVLGTNTMIDMNAMTENYRDYRVGVNFADINGLMSSRYAIDRHIATSKPQYIDGMNEDGAIRYQRQFGARYLGKVDALLRLFFMLLHCSGGLPARCESDKTIAIVNLEGISRSIYLFQGSVVVVIWSGKNRSVSRRSDQSVRYMHPKIGKMIATYILFVAPFAARLSEQLFETNAYATHLLCKNGQRMDGRSLTRTFQSEFSARTKMVVGVLDYRQGIEALVKRTLATRAMEHFDAHAQHSSITSDMRYGNCANELGGIGKDTLKRMVDASKQFDGELLQLGSTKRILETNVSGIVARFSEQPSKKAKRQFAAASFDADASKKAAEVFEKLFGRGAKAQSTEQFNALGVTLQRGADVLVVLRTGIGKSVLFLGPPLIEDKVTILIVPLVVLVQSTISKCEKHRVRYQEYHEEMNIDPMTRLIVTNVEKTNSTSFLGFLRILDQVIGVARIVLDEAHVFATSTSYREAMPAMGQLRCIAVPLVLITATCSQEFEEILASFFHGRFARIRSSTDRENLEYRVRYSQGTSNMDREITEQLVRFVEKTVEQPRMRAIVYCMSVSDVHQWAEKLESVGLASCMYTGAMGGRDRAIHFGAFQSDAGPKIMVATSAFGCGVDHDAVTLVVHVGGAYSLYEYAQQVGRGGRGGQVCECIVYTSDPTFVQDKHMRAYVENTTECRRSMLQSYLDGQPVYCASGNDIAKCDICKAMEQSSEHAQLAMPSSGTPVASAGHDSAQAVPNEVLVSMAESIAEHENVAQEGAMLLRIIEMYGTSMDVNRGRAAVRRKTNSMCVFCFSANGSRAWHTMYQCPWIKGKCFRCGRKERHDYSQCSKPSLKDLHYHCTRCFLPKELAGVQLHASMGNACDTGLGEFSWEFACFVYRERLEQLKQRMRRQGLALDFTDWNDYREWLLQYTNGVPNFVRILTVMVRIE